MKTNWREHALPDFKIQSKTTVKREHGIVYKHRQIDMKQNKNKPTT